MGGGGYACYFGCKAIDWLRGIRSSCERFHTWSQCCHFERNCLKLNGLALFSDQYAPDVLKPYNISTLSAMDRVHLLWDTYKADNLKASTRVNRR